MSFVAAAVGVGAVAGVAGSVYAGNQAASAARQQAGAAQQASNQQLAEFNTINAQQQPYRDAGQAGLSRLGDLLGTSGNTGANGYGSMGQGFTSADLNANLAPNYQFMLNQGLGNARNQLDASGGLIGGNAMQGLNTFAQNYAKNAYQDAFNNYQTQQGNIYNRLASLAGLGQTAVGNTSAAGQNAVNASGNYLTSGAAAQAAGQVGQANAYSSGLGNAGSSAMLYSLLRPSGGGTTDPSNILNPSIGLSYD